MSTGTKYQSNNLHLNYRCQQNRTYGIVHFECRDTGYLTVPDLVPTGVTDFHMIRGKIKEITNSVRNLVWICKEKNMKDCNQRKALSYRHLKIFFLFLKT